MDNENKQRVKHDEQINTSTFLEPFYPLVFDMHIVSTLSLTSHNLLPRGSHGNMLRGRTLRRGSQELLAQAARDFYAKLGARQRNFPLQAVLWKEMEAVSESHDFFY